MKKPKPFLLNQPISCNVCKSVCSSTIAAEKSGWDWFKGYLPERFAVCAFCLENVSGYVEEMRVQSQIERRLPPSKGTPKNLMKSRIILP